jgi:hypothetical protein
VNEGKGVLTCRKGHVELGGWRWWFAAHESVA